MTFLNDRGLRLVAQVIILPREFAVRFRVDVPNFHGQVTFAGGP